MANKRIVVIGGSAAGPKAAAKARRIDENAEVIIIQKDPDLSMASCGYPYYVGGYFDDRNQLLCTPTGIVRDPKFYLNAKAIEARTNTEVLAIDREAHTLSLSDTLTGETGSLRYDKLIIATGAT
ncbi:MAG TPA: FAD-dependent oxidoreductase, partial [Deltaproteobacteria bacterium]|nr:FAD-dependent oxidoreductase [Deltaproteobacteria bacterium]